VDSLKQTVDALNFPIIVRKFTQCPSCIHTVLPDRDFKSECHLPVKFS